MPRYGNVLRGDRCEANVTRVLDVIGLHFETKMLTGWVEGESRTLWVGGLRLRSNILATPVVRYTLGR